MRPHLRRISRLTPRPDSTQSGQRVRTFPVLAGTDSSNPVCSSKESAANLLRAAEIIRSGAARILRLSEFKIADAMRIYTDTHNVTEGAGAAPLAGLIRERQRCSGKRAAVICSGSTIDAPVFAEILAGRTPAA